MEANIGFPMEVDTFAFNKLSLYFHHNKITSILNSSLKGKTVSSVTPGGGTIKNFFLLFTFNKDDNKLEFSIVNCDMLKVENKIKLEYSQEEKEINSIIHKVLMTLIENCAY